MNLNKILTRTCAVLALTLAVIGFSSDAGSAEPIQMGTSSARAILGNSVCSADGVTLAVALPSDTPGFSSGFDLTIEGVLHSVDDIPFGQSTTFIVVLPQLTSYPETMVDGVQYLYNDDSDDEVDYTVKFPACENLPVPATTSTSVPETTTTTEPVPSETTTSTIPVETTTSTTMVPAMLIPEVTTSVVPETTTSTIAVAIAGGISEEKAASDTGTLAYTGGAVPGLPYFAAGLLFLGIGVMAFYRKPAR